MRDVSDHISPSRNPIVIGPDILLAKLRSRLLHMRLRPPAQSISRNRVNVARSRPGVFEKNARIPEQRKIGLRIVAQLVKPFIPTDYRREVGCKTLEEHGSVVCRDDKARL